MKKFLKRAVKLFNKLRLDDEHRDASRFSRRAEILKDMDNRISAEELKKQQTRYDFDMESD